MRMIVGLALVVVALSARTAGAVPDEVKQCYVQSEHVYNNTNWSKLSYFQFQSHYNKNMDKCFVTIEGVIKSEQEYLTIILDAYEGTELAYLLTSMYGNVVKDCYVHYVVPEEILPENDKTPRIDREKVRCVDRNAFDRVTAEYFKD